MTEGAADAASVKAAEEAERGAADKANGVPAEEAEAGGKRRGGRQGERQGR